MPDQNQKHSGPTPTGQEPPELPPAPEREKSWLRHLIVDVLLAKLRLTPLGPHLKAEQQHFKVIRKLVPVSLTGGATILLLLGVVAGFWSKSRLVAPKLQALNITNSFLIGTLIQREKDNQHLERQIEKVQQEGDNKIERLRQDYNNQTTQLTTDRNEAKREKDMVQQRLDFYQSLPEKVLSLYTNICNLYTNDPANRQELSSILMSLQSITNSLSDIGSRPRFKVSVNDSNLTENVTMVLPVDKSRDLYFRATNIGEITAENLTIDIFAPVDGTNVIASGWETQVPSSGSFMTNNHVVVMTNLCHWLVVAQKSIANGYYFLSPPFTISTNYTGAAFPLSINVHSDRAKLQTFGAFVVFLSN